MKPVLNIVAAFASGALAVYLLERYLGRAQSVLPARRQDSPSDGRQEDAELRERVRARLGQWVSHPRAIEVDVDNGVVRVSGEVLAKELDGLLSQLTSVAGVRKVHNALTALDDPSGFGEVPQGTAQTFPH